jgi:HemY protein
MRAALWLLSLFALAAAAAWLAGHNQGTVTLFLTPYRIDLSLNLVLLMLGGVVLVVVLAQQALSALLSLPQQAKRWRLQQKERAAHAALLESISQFMAGRFLRARKAAQSALEKEALLRDAGLELDHAIALRTLAHIMVAESAHALQDREVRRVHWEGALSVAKEGPSSERRWMTAMRRAAWRFCRPCHPPRRAAWWPCGCSSRRPVWPGNLHKPWTQPCCWPNTAPSRPPPPTAWCAA